MSVAMTDSCFFVLIIRVLIYGHPSDYLDIPFRLPEVKMKIFDVPDPERA